MARPLVSLAHLRTALRAFASARDWQQFHTPKNLAMALSVEAAEVLEHFQWLTAEQSLHLNEQRRLAVAEELADVLMYLVRLADVLEIDLLDAARRKLRSNGRKYPVRRAKGNARKYNER